MTPGKQTNQKESLEDRIVLVAGAGGIGGACARVLAREGATVVLAAHKKTDSDRVRDEIGETNGHVHSMELDVTDLSSVSGITRKIYQRFGKIDVLINAFGKGVMKPLLDVHPDTARSVIDTNVYGTFLITQAVMRYMETFKKGTVIFFPGIFGNENVKNSSVLSATKYAVAGFAKTLAEENPRTDIRMCLIYNGPTDTPFWDSEQMDSKTSKDKMLKPADIADVVLRVIKQPARTAINEVVIQPPSAV